MYGLLNARVDAKVRPDEVAALLHTARTLSHVLGLSSRAPHDAVVHARLVYGAPDKPETSLVTSGCRASVLATLVAQPVNVTPETCRR